MKDVKSTMERLKKVAQGAAMMTETTVDIEMGCGCCELSTNEAFADLAYANLIEADGPKYTKRRTTICKRVAENRGTRYHRERKKSSPSL